MGKFLAALEVLRQGKSVSDPAAWKNGQITVAMLTGFLGALLGLARAFGVDLPLSDEQVATVASGMLAVTGLLVHPVLTVATSDKVGLPSKTSTPATPGVPWN